MSIKLCDQELEHIRCHVCSSCDVCVEATGGHRKGSPQCGGVGEEARSTAAPPGWYLEVGGGPAPDLWTLVAFYSLTKLCLKGSYLVT